MLIIFSRYRDADFKHTICKSNQWIEFDSFPLFVPIKFFMTKKNKIDGDGMLTE